MGEKLKELREKADLSQEELAKLSGVSRVTISNIENGACKSVLTTTIAAIADALGVQVSVFFT